MKHASCVLLLGVLILKSLDSGAVIRTDGCPNEATRACYALLIRNAKGTDASGKQVEAGDLLFSGALTHDEAARDLKYLAIALFHMPSDGLQVTLAPVHYAAEAAGRARDARVLFTISKDGLTQTFGLGRAD